MADKSKPGLWANIHAKRKRGESPAKPGDEDYPDAKNWKKVTSISEKKAAPAWQTSEGKNPEGGLNEKGRASLKAQGHDIKRPQPEGGPRKDSFCARMKGMKAKLTSKETANDPDSRINKSLRKWKCGSFDMGKEANSMSNSQIVLKAFNKSAAYKQANPFLDKLKSLGSGIKNMGAGMASSPMAASALSYYNKLDPYTRSALLGSLGGAAVGGIGNAVFGDRSQGLLKRLGRGAMGGAALGGATGALTRLGQEKLDDPIQQLKGNAARISALAKDKASRGFDRAKSLADSLAMRLGLKKDPNAPDVDMSMTPVPSDLELSPSIPSPGALGTGMPVGAPKLNIPIIPPFNVAAARR